MNNIDRNILIEKGINIKMIDLHIPDPNVIRQRFTEKELIDDTRRAYFGREEFLNRLTVEKILKDREYAIGLITGTISETFYDEFDCVLH